MRAVPSRRFVKTLDTLPAHDVKRVQRTIEVLRQGATTGHPRYDGLRAIRVSGVLRLLYETHPDGLILVDVVRRGNHRYFRTER